MNHLTYSELVTVVALAAGGLACLGACIAVMALAVQQRKDRDER